MSTYRTGKYNYACNTQFNALLRIITNTVFLVFAQNGCFIKAIFKNLIFINQITW